MKQPDEFYINERGFVPADLVAEHVDALVTAMAIVRMVVSITALDGEQPEAAVMTTMQRTYGTLGSIIHFANDDSSEQIERRVDQEFAGWGFIKTSSEPFDA